MDDSQSSLLEVEVMIKTRHIVFCASSEGNRKDQCVFLSNKVNHNMFLVGLIVANFTATIF